MNLGHRIKISREKLGLSQSELGELCGWDDAAARISNYENNARQPKLGDISILAKALKASPEWIAYEVGAQPDYLPTKSIPEYKIPLVPWQSVWLWCKSYNLESLIETTAFRAGQSAAGDALNSLEFIAVPEKRNSKQFALRIKGDSMVPSAPGKRTFLEGDIIIADPEKTPSNMDYVIALQKGSQEAIFKQYVIDGNHQYLRPLNPQYPLIALDEHIQICGVVVAHLDVLI